MVAALVLAGEPVDDLLRGEALAQEREAVRPVARVRVRLRGDRADVRLGPRDDRADRRGTSTARRRPTAPPRGRTATIEYVAISGLSHTCASIRSISSSSVRRHEHAGYFRAGQRRQHLLLACPRARRRASPPRAPRAAAPVVELVEHERLGRELDLTLDRELRHLLTRRAEPALPQTSTVSPGSMRDDLDSRRRELPQLVGRAGEDRERAVVARDALRDAEELERDGRLLRVHRVVAADRENRDVRRVEPLDQLHVAEDVRVAREVDLRAVLDLEHEADGLAEVDHVVVVDRAARVLRVGERDLDAVEVDRPALVRVADRCPPRPPSSSRRASRRARPAPRPCSRASGPDRACFRRGRRGRA